MADPAVEAALAALAGRVAALEQQGHISVSPFVSSGPTATELLRLGLLIIPLGTAARTDTAAADGELHAYETGGNRFLGLFSRLANAWTYQQLGASGGVTAHGALTGLAVDDHTQYRLESADHSHQSAGLQAGALDHGLALTGLADDDHTLYLKEEASGGLASEVPDHTHASAAEASGPLLAANTHASPAADTHHAQAHGASDHTNRTRKVPLTFYDQTNASAVPDSDTHGLFNANAPHWDLSATVATHLWSHPVQMPEDYVAGTVTLKWRHSSAAAGGNIRWATNIYEVPDAATAHTSLLVDNVTIAANAAADTTQSQSNNLTTNPTQGRSIVVNVGRLGAHVADTNAGVSSIWEAWLEYTSDE